jgi:DNA polymerase-1
MVREEILNKTEILDKIIELRHIESLISSYLDLEVDSENRVHTSFSLKETGRLASSEDELGRGTHLQNIPGATARDEEAERYHVNIRRMYIADEGKVLVEADKKQGENRIVAWLAEETQMKAAFAKGLDFHLENAKRIFKTQSPSASQRQFAKTRTHGWDYLLQAKNETERVAREAYFNAYPRLKLWQERVSREVAQSHKLTNPFGRVRLFFDKVGAKLYQEAIAFLPQSTLVDDVNRSMIEIFYRSEPYLELLHQCHDSLLFQVKESLVKWAVKLILEFMQLPFICGGEILIIPIEVKVGKSWGEMESYEG